MWLSATSPVAKDCLEKSSGRKRLCFLQLRQELELNAVHQVAELSQPMLLEPHRAEGVLSSGEGQVDF